MGSQGAGVAEHMALFENAMAHVWHSSGETFQMAMADQPYQRSIHANGQSAERVGEPLRVVIEEMCQRIEASLNRVAERLEASFNEKFYAALPAASHNLQRKGSPPAPPTFFISPYQTSAAGSGSTARSIAAVSDNQLERDLFGDQSASKRVEFQQRSASQSKSSTQQLGNSDNSGQASAAVSIGQSSSNPTQAKSFFSQTTSEDAGDRSQNSSMRPGSNIIADLSSMTDHTFIDGVMKRAHWEISQLQKGDTAHSWFEKAYRRKVNEKSSLHEMLIALGCGKFLLKKEPKNKLVDIASSVWFRSTAMGVVMISTVFSAYEADQQSQMYLREPPETEPDWFSFANNAFNIFFCVELLVRLAAYRAWFFMDPGRWRWNVLDLFLVVVSVLAAASDGVDIYFIRVVRTIRVIRIARVFRIANGIVELRKLLLAIVASIASLMWAVLFLFLTMFVFSILILQGVSTEIKYIDDNAHIIEHARIHFNGMLTCLKTLFIVVCGSDWLEPHDLLSNFGSVYSVIMPVFVIFVNIGVMNVVVGVFAEAAAGCRDRDIIAQDEIGATEDFIATMLYLWHDLQEDDEESGWEVFKQYFYNEEVQAYLSFHQIDASHAHLLFELCDRDHNNTVDIREFVLGLLRCKGSARHLHSKVIMHVLSAVSADLECIRHEVRKITDVRVVDAHA